MKTLTLIFQYAPARIGISEMEQDLFSFLFVCSGFLAEIRVRKGELKLLLGVGEVQREGGNQEQRRG